MFLLAVETSCDETSAAIIGNGQVLSNVVSSQIPMHSEYGGVVPELATREHLRNFLPVADEAFRAAGIKPADIYAVAATQGPGLPNAVMIGLKAAQAFAFAIDKPFLGIHHHEAHLFSPWITGDPPRADFADFEPSVSLIVSGGHTMLVHVKSETEHRILGATVDDAAGECFDKTAKLLGLSYPGGPEMDRLAREGNPSAHEFPRPMLKEDNDNFSFSGLKTAVRYFLDKHPDLPNQPQALRDLCASVQAAIVETLVVKTVRAATRTDVNLITASGGVIGNSELRERLRSRCDQQGLKLRLADPRFCTDNAAMIGILAERQLNQRADATDLDADPRPNWPLSAPGGSIGVDPI